MKTCLLFYGVAVGLALAQPVVENDSQRLIRLSDIIIKGEVIRTEEQKVVALTAASAGVSYVRPDNCLKGDPVKTEVTLMDNMPVVVHYRKVPAVRVGWWRETPAMGAPARSTKQISGFCTSNRARRTHTVLLASRTFRRNRRLWSRSKGSHDFV